MNYRRLLFFVIRFLVYAMIMAGMYFIFLFDATHQTGEIKITENSLTEITQEIFVFLSAIGFFIAGRQSKVLAPVLNLLSLFFVMSFIREFNNHIDFWFYLVLPFLGLFVFLLVRNFKQVLSAFTQFVELRTSGAFFIGFLVTYLFSRLFGKTVLWMALMEDGYRRTAKNMAEEGIELLGYAIILISVVELMAFLRSEFSERKKG
jgi:hypothetical protein